MFLLHNLHHPPTLFDLGMLLPIALRASRLRVPSTLRVERRAAAALASERHPPVGEDGIAYRLERP